ncbi:MAG: hypothetical protein ACI9WL_001588 [Rubritalea sp.]|jgi:hypothetical protein
MVIFKNMISLKTTSLVLAVFLCPLLSTAQDLQKPTYPEFSEYK